MFSKLFPQRKDETYYDLVCSQSEAFERYLRRNKRVSALQVTSLRNFCTSIKRLARLKIHSTYGNKEAIGKFRAEILSTRLFYNRSWFLQQMQ